VAWNDDLVPQAYTAPSTEAVGETVNDDGSTLTAASDDQAPKIGPRSESSEPMRGLKGNLGIFALVCTVLAFNAPLGTIAGVMPVAIGLGNGAGAPIFYLAGAVIMSVMAIGFIKMSRYIKNSGGFYSYVTAGLGREMGLGTSFLAVSGYIVQTLGSMIFGGVALHGLVSGVLRGPDIPWWVYALASVLVIGVLGYFRLDVSAKVLTFLLGAEILFVLAYDAVIVFRGGATGLDVASSLSTSTIFSGSFGVALLIGVMGLGGFEATVVFREEVRNPERTVAISTYLFIAIVGIMYGVTCWVMVQAIGSGSAQAYYAADPAGNLLATVKNYLGIVYYDLINVLLNTSILAASLALHNISARYVYNLGRDGVLPQFFGVAHARHDSPYRASILVSLLVGGGILLALALRVDETFFFAQLLGAFGYAFMIMLLITTVAVAVFLTRLKAPETNLWHRLIAPVLAFFGVGTVLVLATMNLDVLFTAPRSTTYVIVAVMYGTVVLGVVVALILKRVRPETYARIGRQGDV
jgi:amino acid transporter